VKKLSGHRAVKENSVGSPGHKPSLSEQREDGMAKGQMRSNKEKKKPKQDKNKQKGGPAPSPFAAGQGQAKPGGTPYGKK
jgi:hypothetical protein